MKKWISASIILSLIVSLLSGIGTVEKTVKAAGYGLSNPRVEMQTRDVIEFGSYWQEEYTPEKEIEYPQDGEIYTDTDSNSTEMIFQGGKFFKKSPITWRILKQDGDDLFLLADQVLDCKKYHETNTDVTWETCTLRSWLNRDFYDAAFSDSEKMAIKQTTVSNEDNPKYGTGGGKDTTDRLFLLSNSENVNTDYGFQSHRYFYDQARHAKATDYAKAQGCDTNREGMSWWWLRSPGIDSSSATYVDDDGDVSSNGGSVGDYGSGVRPALHVNAANAAISSALVNKTTEEVALAKTTWDTVEFGTYNGAKIQWRVLSVDGDDAFLLADRILLQKEYNEEDTSVTWETSTLRKWLNDDFYKEAFTSAEQAAIHKRTITNEDNPFYGTEGGNNTEDSVYLLSLSDMVNPSYGFPTSYECESASRQAVPTNSEDPSWWWLRSPGGSSSDASDVTYRGCVRYSGHIVDLDDNGVRPALHLNLSSSVWTKGEVVTSEDKKTASTDDLPGENPTPTKTPDTTADTTQSTSTSQVPTTSTAGTSTSTQTNTDTGATKDQNDTAPAKVTGLKVTNKKAGKTIVSFKKVSGVAGYQIQYALNKKFTKAKKSKTTKKNSLTLKKLKKKKTYYIRVRSYKFSGKKKIYGKWSVVKKVKIKK